MPDSLIVTPAPHIRDKITIQKIMADVIISLLPLCLFSIILYRLSSLKIIVTCIISSIIAEWITQKIMKRKTTLHDLSACVTGLLFALTLPPGIPIWMAVIGSFFGICVTKQMFGGLGHNPFNPALSARAFLQISFPLQMSKFVSPYDLVTSATPLSISKYQLDGVIPDIKSLLIGTYPGSIGETSVILILLGGVYLALKKHISFLTPISYISVVFLLTIIFNANPIFHIFSGGLMLGAFYMATDPVTTPITPKGKMIFGIGCGIITALIRLKGSFPEGVCFSILIMNMLTPLINKITKPRRFGTKCLTKE